MRRRSTANHPGVDRRLARVIVPVALVAAGLPARADALCVDYAPFSHLPGATISAEEHRSDDGECHDVSGTTQRARDQRRPAEG